jgi:hypothetical protein
MNLVVSDVEYQDCVSLNHVNIIHTSYIYTASCSLNIRYLRCRPESSQSQSQNQQTYITQYTQSSQNNHNIPTRPKPLPPQTILTNFRKELPIPLHPPKRTYSQNTRSIDSKQSSNTIKLCRKNLENHQSEAELS